MKHGNQSCHLIGTTYQNSEVLVEKLPYIKLIMQDKDEIL